MKPDSIPPSAPPRETRHFDSRAEFQAALRDALEQAAVAGCKEMIWCDPDFSDWPIGERDCIERLSRWAMSHRRLVVLAARFDAIERQHPRFVTWRRAWSHVVHCRQVDEADVAAMPSLLLAPGLFALKLHDPLRFRGRIGWSRPEEVRDRDEVDAFLQRSHESFPVTRLGL